MNAQQIYQLSQHSLGGLASSLNLDAGETPNFKREFEYVFNEVYRAKYAMGKAMLLFPVNPLPRNKRMDKTYTFKTGDRVGGADFVAEGSPDIPTSELSGDEVTQYIKPIKTAFMYTVEDLARVGYNNFNIPSDKAEGAIQDVLNKHNKAFWLGDAAYNVTGILNNPNIDGAAVANGASASPLWTSKTADEILKDLVDAVNLMLNNTLGLERPNILILSYTSYNLLATTRYNTYSDKRILEAFNSIFPEIIVDSDVTLNNAFSGGTNGFLLGNNKDRRIIELIAPIPYELQQPVFDGVGFKVIASGRNGGAKITTPKAFLKRWGI